MSLPLRPPEAVLDIARALERAGFEAWCVGGAVRDALLGHPNLDWDLATSATPDQMRELFGRRRTIPIGVEFGTVGVLDPAGKMHEVTTFRHDVATDGRHAVVAFGASLDDDLARRDFTINAIAYSPSKDELRDPFDGRGDLARKLVRAVGDPEARMAEDRLRSLRAIRFASRFEFAIEPATLRAIEGSAPHLGRLSAERVKQELDKTMEQVRRPSHALERWLDVGAFASLIPELAGVDRRRFAVVDGMALPGPGGRPRRRLDRMTALLSTAPSGEAGAAAVLERLRAPKRETQWTATVIERWTSVRGELEQSLAPAMEPLFFAALPRGDAVIRSWVSRIGRLHVGAVMRLAQATWRVDRLWGTASVPRDEAARRLYRRMLRIAFRDPIEVRDLAIDGDDLRRAGIAPGPELGRILTALLRDVLEDPARNDADRLLQQARRLAQGTSTE
jgi:tRNA nucleotidyltransferase (CCA-adding enzyme)